MSDMPATAVGSIEVHRDWYGQRSFGGYDAEEAGYHDRYSRRRRPPGSRLRRSWPGHRPPRHVGTGGPARRPHGRAHWHPFSPERVGRWRAGRRRRWIRGVLASSPLASFSHKRCVGPAMRACRTANGRVNRNLTIRLSPSGDGNKTWLVTAHYPLAQSTRPRPPDRRFSRYAPASAMTRDE